MMSPKTAASGVYPAATMTNWVRESPNMMTNLRTILHLRQTENNVNKPQGMPAQTWQTSMNIYDKDCS